MPFTCRIDPDRRGDPLVAPGMVTGSSAAPPVMAGGPEGGPNQLPSPASGPAVKRRTQARVKCRTLVWSICLSVL